MRAWQSALQLKDEFFVSVNLSPRQLSTETMLNDMRALVSQHKHVARHLKLEMTECQVMTNPEHSAYVLAALKAMGLRLALDDFGTGHSSLSYLHRFPFDTIKIAAPFVQISDDIRLCAHPGADHPLHRAPGHRARPDGHRRRRRDRGRRAPPAAA